MKKEPSFPNSHIQSKGSNIILKNMELVIQLYQYDYMTESNEYVRISKENRQYEILDCLHRNLLNPHINKIHILLEKESNYEFYKMCIKNNPQKDKCVFTVFGSQPRYADLVEYCKNTIKDNTIVCIQNSDIYFGHDLLPSFLEETVDLNTLVSLTRHEHTSDTHDICNENTCPLIYDYQGSHDSFLFRTPIPESFPFYSVTHYQNVYGGETVFMKAWVECGKQLKNPCFDIKIFHRHINHFYLKQYETIANGYLCNINPSAPIGRDDIKSQLKTIFKS